jgi:hypothetical protein
MISNSINKIGSILGWGLPIIVEGNNHSDFMEKTKKKETEIVEMFHQRWQKQIEKIFHFNCGHITLPAWDFPNILHEFHQQSQETVLVPKETPVSWNGVVLSQGPPAFCNIPSILLCNSLHQDLYMYQSKVFLFPGIEEPGWLDLLIDVNNHVLWRKVLVLFWEDQNGSNVRIQYY